MLTNIIKGKENQITGSSKEAKVIILSQNIFASSSTLLTHTHMILITRLWPDWPDQLLWHCRAL